MRRHNDSDDPDDGESDENEGFGLDIGIGVRTIADILRELDEQGRAAGNGHRDGIEYDYSARTGLGPRSEGEDDRGTRPRRKRIRPLDAIDAHVDVRHEGDEMVVTADLPGVADDDLSLAFDADANELVIGVEGSVVERLPIPWDVIEVADAALNNGVLVVRLREDLK